MSHFFNYGATNFKYYLSKKLKNVVLENKKVPMNFFSTFATLT